MNDPTDRDTERLDGLEKSVAKGTERLDGLEKSVGQIQRTLADMASQEIADLRRRADAPRRFVNAIMVATMATVIPALLIYLATHVHVG